VPHGSPGNTTWPAESFLGRLTAAECAGMLACGRHATYQPGEQLIIDGDRGGGFVILLQAGQVKVVMRDEQGNEQLIGIRSRGSLLGEMSYFDQQPRSASVVAINHVRASKLARDSLDVYLREHPRVGTEIARVLVDRLRASDASSRDIRNDPVPVRVAKLLLSLAGAFDGSAIPLSQAEIAQLARAAEVTVNRTLRAFRDRHVVLIKYRKVVVPCLACLDRLVAAVAADPKDGAKGVLGCGGAGPHPRQ
jgi:CRP-like cAMP-binding protein